MEAAIINGEYKPGVKLDLELLAKKFGCSRTPIREALQLLENSGLVRVAPKQGTFVSQFSVEELTDRFEVMAELEALCASLSARRMTLEEIDDLESTNEKCHKHVIAADYDAYYNENNLFHSKIYSGSRNPFLAKEAQNLQAVLHPYRRMQLRVRNRMKKSLAEHNEITEAIRTGDDIAVKDIMRNHVKIQGDRYNDFISFMRAM